MEQFSISGNFSALDPIEEYLKDCPPERQAIDKSLSERCREPFRKGLNLVLRWGEYSTQEDIDAYKNLLCRSQTLMTPPVRYETAKGHEGVIWLEAGMMVNQRTSTTEPHTIEIPSLGLWVRADAWPRENHQVMTLTNERLICHGQEGAYSGGHGELNYFWTVIDKIWDKALPVDPKEKTELEIERRRRLGRTIDNRGDNL